MFDIAIFVTTISNPFCAYLTSELFTKYASSFVMKQTVHDVVASTQHPIKFLCSKFLICQTHTEPVNIPTPYTLGMINGLFGSILNFQGSTGLVVKIGPLRVTQQLIL
jgi:hypothetical protein